MHATSKVPDAAGRFGSFGGRYAPETLTQALDELTAQYARTAADPVFHGHAKRARTIM
jgi:tryptophan synthase beta chain